MLDGTVTCQGETCAYEDCEFCPMDMDDGQVNEHEPYVGAFDRKEDLAFIAAARQAVPALIAEVKQRRGVTRWLAGEALSAVPLEYALGFDPGSPEGYLLAGLGRCRAERDKLRAENEALKAKLAGSQEASRQLLLDRDVFYRERDAMRAQIESLKALNAARLEQISRADAQLASLKSEMARLVLALDGE